MCTPHLTDETVNIPEQQASTNQESIVEPELVHKPTIAEYDADNPVIQLLRHNDRAIEFASGLSAISPQTWIICSIRAPFSAARFPTSAIFSGSRRRL